MTPDLFWLPLLVKIGATVALVVGASVAAERSGPFLGALIATLPVSAGPAYIFSLWRPTTPSWPKAP
jgi:hypothetical protein